ncbi:putative peroxin 11c protein [Phaeoacremonium minimum UCRPA7]|uniref:Putative peroxin 11c protein n=1 Tax=Phaeoacremonium minimum (strain UCR-PA7) TaxID=1286976 RepID=R8BQP1_PHAM7|nr:putative peroxin 11c protein [Phaeoacremonium minimum UCRPA7]EOO01600.1 putative peroxin 11c protein [Phaeoacremonium minimum UCRPA7]
MAEESSQAIADLPTGEPIPSSSPPPSSKKPSPLPLRALLAAAPSNIDAFLAHLHRCLQTPSGIDTVLLFLCYTSRFNSAALTSLSQSLLRRSARELIALAFTLPPRTTVLFSVPGKSPGKSAAAELALLLAGRLKSLASLISELRMMMRLWGLLGMYFWGKGLANKLLAARQAKVTTDGGEKTGDDAAAAPKESPLVTAVAWTQWLSCVVFQALENGAYLSSKGVLGWSPQAQARAYSIGTKAWGVYVAVELGRLAAEIVAKRRAAREPSVSAADAESAKTELVGLRTEFVRNAAWAPLILHWSSEKGLVSDMTVGLLGSIPGVMQMRRLWRETA